MVASTILSFCVRTKSCLLYTSINRALEKGLVLISAGTNIIRFVPPLVVTEEDMDKMAEILDEVFQEIDE